MAQATNYIHIPACTVSRKRHSSLPRPVLSTLQLAKMYFRYVAPHCNSVKKSTTTKARKKDLKEKAKIWRSMRLLKSVVGQDTKKKAIPQGTHDFNQRHKALMVLKGMRRCKNICWPGEASWKCMLQESGHQSSLVWMNCNSDQQESCKRTQACHRPLSRRTSSSHS